MRGSLMLKRAHPRGPTSQRSLAGSSHRAGAYGRGGSRSSSPARTRNTSPVQQRLPHQGPATCSGKAAVCLPAGALIRTDRRPGRPRDVLAHALHTLNQSLHAPSRSPTGGPQAKGSGDILPRQSVQHSLESRPLEGAGAGVVAPANKCRRQKRLGHPRENPRRDTFPPHSLSHCGPPGPKRGANLTAEDFPRDSPRPSHVAGTILPAFVCSAALQVRPPRHHHRALDLAVFHGDHVGVPQPQAGSHGGLLTSPYALSAEPAPSSQTCSKGTPRSKGLRPEIALEPSHDLDLSPSQLHCQPPR